jgi:hypothetical protein
MLSGSRAFRPAAASGGAGAGWSVGDGKRSASQKQVEDEREDDRGDEGDHDHRQAPPSPAERSDVPVSQLHSRPLYPPHPARRGARPPGRRTGGTSDPG